MRLHEHEHSLKVNHAPIWKQVLVLSQPPARVQTGVDDVAAGTPDSSLDYDRPLTPVLPPDHLF